MDMILVSKTERMLLRQGFVIFQYKNNCFFMLRYQYYRILKQFCYILLFNYSLICIVDILLFNKRNSRKYFKLSNQI
jgi:hypothetical protein